MKSDLLTAIPIVLVSTAVVAAHHASSAEFDASKPVTITGKVTRVEWINPHAWIHVEVTEPDGRTVTWKVEGGSPNVLMRRGLKREALAPGTMLTVEGARARDGTPKVNGRRVTLTDGRMLSLDQPSGDTPARRPDR